MAFGFYVWLPLLVCGVSLRLVLAEEDVDRSDFNLDDVTPPVEFVPDLPRRNKSQDAPSRHTRSVVADKTLLWPNGEIRYGFYTQHWRGRFTSTHENTMRRAMRYLEDHTCLKFTEVSENDARYGGPGHLLIAGGWRGGDCQSDVGMQNRPGSPQVTWFLTGCLRQYGGNSVAHELMHSLGFFHEHTRPDRDEYIKVNYENMRPSGIPNFRIWPDRIDTLRTEYDYQSVMHYNSYQYVKRGAKFGTHVIEPKQAGVRIGQRQAPSLMDLHRINLLYNCPRRDSFSDVISCNDCIKHFTIIARTSSTPTAGSTAKYLTLNTVFLDGATYRSRSYRLSNDRGASLQRGATAIWRVRPNMPCLRVKSIEMLAVRANGIDNWVAKSMDVHARLASGTVLVARLNTTSADRNLTLAGTEEQAQAILQASKETNCKVCSDSCIDSFVVTVKYNQPQRVVVPFDFFVLTRQTRMAQWQYTLRNVSDNAANSRVLQFIFKPALGRSCIQPSSITLTAVTRFENNVLQPLPTGMESLFVVAVAGESRYVMMDQHYTRAQQQEQRSLVYAKPLDCGGECNRCS